MASLIYILFVCIAIPLIMLLVLLEGRARLVVGFMLIGMFMCLFASELNGLVLGTGLASMQYITTNITPAIEEILKALPVLFFAFVISDERGKLLPIGMAVGIGFAILENAYIMVDSIETVTIPWAVVRGIGAGLMHGICTMSIGLGASFVRKKRILFVSGSLGLIVLAEIYHGTYNMLVQSQYRYAGILLPILTYLPLLWFLFKNKKTTDKDANGLVSV